ncbi:hypothetical protein ACOQH0_12725 [Enterobacter sp. JS8-1]|uniref:hypothetical protein n=1 Tax=Enterobacter sp. JS8-1 TaxID=3411633 RepID=UPI003BA2A1FC
MAKLMLASSHKTGTQSAGLFMPFTREILFLSSACIRCMSLHPFCIPMFASQRQRQRGFGS